MLPVLAKKAPYLRRTKVLQERLDNKSFLQIHEEIATAQKTRLKFRNAPITTACILENFNVS